MSNTAKKGRVGITNFIYYGKIKLRKIKQHAFKTALQEPFRNSESSFSEKTKTIITDRSFFLGNFLGL